jgi:hypothetical protein
MTTNIIDFIAKTSENTKTSFTRKEVVAAVVCLCIYIFIRLIERYILPNIPTFLFTEVKRLYTWGIFLIPLLFCYYR